MSVAADAGGRLSTSITGTANELSSRGVPLTFYRIQVESEGASSSVLRSLADFRGLHSALVRAKPQSVALPVLPGGTLASTILAPDPVVMMEELDRYLHRLLTISELAGIASLLDFLGVDARATEASPVDATATASASAAPAPAATLAGQSPLPPLLIPVSRHLQAARAAGGDLLCTLGVPYEPSPAAVIDDEVAGARGEAVRETFGTIVESSSGGTVASSCSSDSSGSAGSSAGGDALYSRPRWNVARLPPQLVCCNRRRSPRNSHPTPTNSTAHINSNQSSHAHLLHTARHIKAASRATVADYHLTTHLPLAPPPPGEPAASAGATAWTRAAECGDGPESLATTHRSGGAPIASHCPTPDGTATVSFALQRHSKLQLQLQPRLHLASVEKVFSQ